MSNLSWLPLFILFNAVFMFSLSISPSNSADYNHNKKSFKMSNKKWPW